MERLITPLSRPFLLFVHFTDNLIFNLYSTEFLPATTILFLYSWNDWHGAKYWMDICGGRDDIYFFLLGEEEILSQILLFPLQKKSHTHRSYHLCSNCKCFLLEYGYSYFATFSYQLSWSMYFFTYLGFKITTFIYFNPLMFEASIISCVVLICFYWLALIQVLSQLLR